MTQPFTFSWTESISEGCTDIRVRILENGVEIHSDLVGENAAGSYTFQIDPMNVYECYAEFLDAEEAILNHQFQLVAFREVNENADSVQLNPILGVAWTYMCHCPTCAAAFVGGGSRVRKIGNNGGDVSIGNDILGGGQPLPILGTGQIKSVPVIPIITPFWTTIVPGQGGSGGNGSGTIE